MKYDDEYRSVEEKFLIHPDFADPLDTYTLTGKSIERMQTEAKKICNLLSRAYGFRVVELAADFIKDKNEVYWLANVVSFILEESNYELKVKEHNHLIENQAVILAAMRSGANDSSNALYSKYNSYM